MMRRVFFFLIISVFLSAGTYFVLSQRQKAIFSAKEKAGWFKLGESVEEMIAKFKGEAGIVILDLKRGWDLSFDSDRKFAAASLVKLPIMLAVFQAADSRRVALDEIFVLGEADKTSGSGVLKRKPAGSRFTIDELVEIMITRSDNTASNIFINRLGFGYLNSFFSSLGLKDTNLFRQMMDFRARRDGKENYTSARDMAWVLEKLYYGSFLSRGISEKCISLLKKQKVNNRISAKLPKGTLIAHKTGLENNICHDAGIVWTPQGDFLICVLTKNASTSEAAKEFISKIALIVYNYYQEA